MNEINEYNENTFEEIKHIDENGNEYWFARELQTVLGYSQWRRFENVIDKAKEACINSNNNVSDHFANVGKMVNAGVSAKEISDYKLSRYACYIIAQNGDSRKKVIALAQTYFAVQTRRMELLDKDYELMNEDERRLFQRNLTKKGNNDLQRAASNSGVKNMDEFHNAGYRGLYNGETADDIYKRKALRYREDILDNMCEDELIANLFRINQTKQKLINDKVKGEQKAKDTHYAVGKKVRDTIKELGGTMPEDMPTPKKSIKKIEKELKKNKKIIEKEKNDLELN